MRKFRNARCKLSFIPALREYFLSIPDFLVPVCILSLQLGCFTVLRILLITVCFCWNQGQELNLKYVFETPLFPSTLRELKLRRTKRCLKYLWRVQI